MVIPARGKGDEDMDGLARVVEPSTADDNDDERIEYQDMPPADFAFLRSAVAKLRGGWRVSEVVDSMPYEDSRVVTFAAIDPDEGNNARTTYEIFRLDDDSYSIGVFRDDLPSDHPNACDEMGGGTSIQNAFANVARHLFDPIARPCLDHFSIWISRGNGSPEFYEVSKTDNGWSAKDIDTKSGHVVTDASSMEAAIEDLARMMQPGALPLRPLTSAVLFGGYRDAAEPSTPGALSICARRAAAGVWEACVLNSSKHFGPCRPTIDEAMMAAWELRSASMTVLEAA